MMKRVLVVVGTIGAVVACGSSGDPGDGGTESGVDATNDVVTVDVANDVVADVTTSDAATDASDACVPLADSPKRGKTCQSPSDCDPGYGCLPVGNGKECQVDCSTSSCACPNGLQCENFPYDGGVSKVCS